MKDINRMVDLMLHYCFLISSISWVIFFELGSVMVKVLNLLSRPFPSWREPVLFSWISLNSANHLCWSVSSKDGLFCLFFSSSFFTNSCASGVIVSHGEKEKSGASWIVYLAISLSSSSSNGRTLERRRYEMTPRLQRSTSLPYGFYSNTSGAT